MEDKENSSPLKVFVLKRVSIISGRDYETLDEEDSMKPLGFILSLPFALLFLVVSLIGAVVYALMSLLHCICPCFYPCIEVIDFILEAALGMIAAPVLVMALIMLAMPC